MSDDITDSPDVDKILEEYEEFLEECGADWGSWISLENAGIIMSLLLVFLLVGILWSLGFLRLPDRIDRYLQKIGLFRIDMAYNRDERKYLDALEAERVTAGEEISFFGGYPNCSQLVARFEVLNEVLAGIDEINDVLDDIIEKMREKLADIGVEIPIFPQLIQIGDYWIEQ